MKYTLLDMTQTILSSMDSDEINSISDTPESLQVATCVRTAYFDLVARANLNEHFSLVTLDASGDSSKPTLMTLPNTVSELMWLKYDKRAAEDDPILMEYVEFLSPEDFLNMMHQMNEDETNVASFSHTLDNDSVTFLYMNDRAPTYYTVFDDYTFIFDSYDADVDTTLQKSKTLGYARNVIPFSMIDSFTPDLDDSQFSLLLNEAKALAWMELKQSIHQKAEINAKRGWTQAQKQKFNSVKENYFDSLPNFGRK